MGRLKEHSLYNESAGEAKHDLLIVGVNSKDCTVSIVSSCLEDAPVQEYRVTEDQVTAARGCLFHRVVLETDGDRLVSFRSLENEELEIAECGICDFIEREYTQANESNLTRDALALQNATLQAKIAGIQAALRDLRVLRSSCDDSNQGDFRVHLCEREWDSFNALVVR
jgi:hypothetical protein